MPTPFQRSQIIRAKNNRRTITAEDPNVYYRGRTARDGVYEFDRSDGSVVRAYLSGNAQPFMGEALVYIPPKKEQGLGLVIGRSVPEEETRIASIPRANYAAAALFTKIIPGSADFWIISGSVRTGQTSLQGSWNVFGLGTTATNEEWQYNVQTLWRPDQSFIYQGSGTFTDTTNVFIRFDIAGPTSGNLRVTGSFNRTSDQENIAGASINRLAVGLDGQDEILPWVSPSAPGTYSIEFDFTAPSDGTVQSFGASAFGLIGNGFGGVGSGLTAESSFRLVFTITTDAPPPESEKTELWLGGDRTALLLKEFDQTDAFSAATGTVHVFNRQQTSVEFEDSSTGPLVFTGSTFMNNVSGSTSASGSISTTGLNVNVAFTEGPSGFVSMYGSIYATLGSFPPGTYRVSGEITIENIPDGNRTSQRVNIGLGDPTLLLDERFYRNVFELTGQSLSGHYAFDETIGTNTDNDLVIAALIGNPTNILVDVYTFDQTLNATYRISITSDLFVYLAATRNRQFVFTLLKNLSTYFIISGAGIDQQTEFVAPNTITSDPEDWRRSLATFASPTPNDPDPCIQQNRLNSFANLQNNQLLSINLSQDINGRTLQDRLLFGESITNAEITVQAATIDGSSCNLGPTQTQKLKSLEPLVPTNEPREVQIRSMVPYRKR